jgi:hypothetical protein
MTKLFFLFAFFLGLSLQAAMPVFDIIGQGQRFYMMVMEAKRIAKEAAAAGKMLSLLGDLDLTNVNEIIDRFSQFKPRIGAIGYDYNGVANHFESFYDSRETIPQKIAAWQGQSDDSIKEAMVSQSLLRRSGDHMRELKKAIELKRNSSGDSDTLQAIGEINAISSKQLADLTEIIGTDARAKNSVLMEERAKEKARRKFEERLLKDFKQQKKSRPLAHFPTLGNSAPRL